MTDAPDDHLDHYALGFYAPGKGLRREDCPYAAGTRASVLWMSGYDAAVSGRAPEPSPADGPAEPPGRG
ncbi:ribosome modulation factor [Methylobacterium sp. JK268]